MNTSCPTSQEVAQWIVSYLTRNPGAADTPRWIQRWWLAPHYGDAPLDVVLQALEQLEKEGMVAKKTDSSLPVPDLYGRGPRFRPLP
jgi:hypothetical protein